MRLRARSAGVVALMGTAAMITTVCATPMRVEAQHVATTSLDSARGATPSEHKSPQVAALLGFVPGVGHLYAGEINRGWLIGAIYWTGVAMGGTGRRTDGVGKAGGVLLVGGLIAGVVDGAYAARRYNARMAKLREPVHKPE